MERLVVESQTFGPSSNAIIINEFLKASHAVQSRVDSITAVLKGEATPDAIPIDEEDDFEPIPPEFKPTIVSECSITDLGSDASTTAMNTKLLEFSRAYHESWQPDPAPGSSKSKGKQKADAIKSSLEDRLKDPEVKELYSVFETVELKSWQKVRAASFYCRPVQAGDRNVLSAIKSNPLSDEEPTSAFPDDGSVALLEYTHYARATLHPLNFRQTSQHVILSHQTLGDIWDNLPCDRKSLPVENTSVSADSAIIPFELPESTLSGVAICVEDIVYGDGLSTPDYSEKLKDYVNRKGPGLVKRGGLMHDTRLCDIELRLHQPYWILHQGDCDHIIVLSQIRLPHLADPRIGYPLLVQRAPAPHPICRICNEYAAEISIVGDVRIGEAVAPVCRACWTALGEPVSGRDDPVVVVPLVREGLI